MLVRETNVAEQIGSLKLGIDSAVPKEIDLNNSCLGLLIESQKAQL